MIAVDSPYTTRGADVDNGTPLVDNPSASVDDPALSVEEA